jgi:hypothetical protein
VPNKHREAFDALGEQIGVRQLNDWYRVTYKEVLSLAPASSIFAYVTIKKQNLGLTKALATSTTVP